MIMSGPPMTSPGTSHPRDDGRVVGRTGSGSGGARTTHPAVNGPTLHGYGRFVRHHRLIIGLMALTGGLVGAVLVTSGPAVFVAQTMVEVPPRPTGADVDPDRPRLVSLDSDAQVLSSGAVLSEAAAVSEFPGGAGALAGSLGVSAIPNSRVLIVRVTHDNRATALRACGAIVAEFLESRAQAEREREATAVALLNEQLTDALDQLAALRANTRPDDPAPALGLAEDVQLVRLRTLQEDLRRVATAGTTAPGTVLAPPVAPSDGARPMASATVLSGLIIGVGAGIGTASLARSRLVNGPLLHRSDRRGSASRRQPSQTVDPP